MRQRMPRVKHMIGLAALLLFVAYFAVWHAYLVMSGHFGQVWGVVAATIGALGLAVIACVGVIVIRTMRTVEEHDDP
jgi:O-antigen ligase